MAEARSRSYACMLYDDSVLPDWKEYIEKTHIQAFCSPIHKGDKESGGKDHRHLMLIFEGKKSKAQVKEIFDDIRGAGIETIHSIRGYARYLCHLDEKEKEHYDPKDVICFAGADYQKYSETDLDQTRELGNLLALAKQKNFKYFYQLIEYCDGDDEMISLIRSNTYMVCEYIRSKRQAWKDEYDHDLQTDNKRPAHSNNRAGTVPE